MDTVEEGPVNEKEKSMPVPVFELDLNFLTHDVAGATNLIPIVKIT